MRSDLIVVAIIVYFSIQDAKYATFNEAPLPESPLEL
jgi:hypothetical protein